LQHDYLSQTQTQQFPELSQSQFPKDNQDDERKKQSSQPS
jgi:predicted Zn-dependent protease